MARQRFIWPDLWHDPAIGRLKPDAMMLYVGCFSNADDSGRLYADPAYLRSKIFPYQDMSLRKVRALRDKICSASRSLRLYEVDGIEYLYFANWSRYQKPKYPKASTIPAPPEEKPSGSDSGNVPESLGEDSPKTEKASPKVPPQGRDGLGREEKSPNGDSATKVAHRLFEHYKIVWGHPRAVLTPARRGLVARRLGEGFSEETLRAAIDGSRRDDWPDRAKPLNHDFELLLRDAKHIEGFVLMAEGSGNGFSPESEDERESRLRREMASRGPR